jgi:hypothetical protein
MSRLWVALLLATCCFAQGNGTFTVTVPIGTSCVVTARTKDSTTTVCRTTSASCYRTTVTQDRIDAAEIGPRECAGILAGEVQKPATKQERFESCTEAVKLGVQIDCSQFK